MITTDQILNAIKARLEAQFPGEPVYINKTPKDFARPSNLVELLRIQLGAFSRNTMELLFTIQITDFVPVDLYFNSDMALLDARTMMLVGGVFGDGYIKVDDRAPKVASCATAHNFDYTETTAVLSCGFARSEFNPSEVLPLMEQLNLKFKEATQ